MGNNILVCMLIKINYLAMYTTILKKKEGDYYLGVKFACLAETSKANNGHQTWYPSPAGRDIVTGLECVWQRSTKCCPALSLYKQSRSHKYSTEPRVMYI